MAVKFEAFDKHKTLSLSAAGHLWLGMAPVAKRGNQPHPGPADSGWQYDFWVWLKEQIFLRKALQNWPKGFQRFSRELYIEIAESDEYADLVKAEPRLKAKPAFLFPEERAGRRQTIAAESKCRRWLVEMMKAGPKAKKKGEWQIEAINKFGLGVRAFERAWSDALIDSGDPHEWNKPGPVKGSS